MTAYLDALDALDAACARLGLGYILPAHGHVMDQARTVIAQLKAHRLAREAKVQAAMSAGPGARWTTGWRWPMTMCHRPSGPSPSARCRPMSNACRPCRDRPDD